MYFGVSRDQAGKDEEFMNLEKGIRVSDIRRELKRKYPSLEDIQNFAVAVNEAYAEDDLGLKNGDTVAIIPPVSGG